MSGPTAASVRVWRRLGAHARTALIRDLPAEDLRIILSDVARARATVSSEEDLLTRWREDAFLQPSLADPRLTLALQTRLWQALPSDFEAVSLSPFTALGSVTRLSGTGQNRVVSTMRGSEVVYDPVHPLALEASRRRRGGYTRVHLAACVQSAHAWEVDEAPRHETRFAAVSSAPDGGSWSTEVSLMAAHLGFWIEALLPVLPTVRLEVVAWEDTARDRLQDSGALDHERVSWGGDGPMWRHPYTVAAFRIMTDDGASLGDGGLVQWTQALTGNRKDRCVISGVSLETAASLVAA
ncbi:MAG: hypothetical protein ACK5LS_01920 [Propioniciclava sp.]